MVAGGSRARRCDHVFGAGHHATETFGVRALGEQLAAQFGVEHTVRRRREPGLSEIFVGAATLPASARGYICIAGHKIGGRTDGESPTPTELAREAGLERREVISKCMEMGVPIFQGRIDKSLFLDNLRQAVSGRPTAEAA